MLSKATGAFTHSLDKGKCQKIKEYWALAGVKEDEALHGKCSHPL